MMGFLERMMMMTLAITMLGNMGKLDHILDKRNKDKLDNMMVSQDMLESILDKQDKLDNCLNKQDKVDNLLENQNKLDNFLNPVNTSSQLSIASTKDRRQVEIKGKTT